MLNVTQLRAGTAFKDAQGIWEVITYKHTKMGRGSANIRVKVKNLITDAVVEKTFSSGQKVAELEVSKRKVQFLYKGSNNVVFMDPKSFDQLTLPKRAVAGKEAFLKEGDTYELMTVEGQALNVEFPRNVVLKVTETGPGIKGDSVSSAQKDATLENGFSVKVPLFIKIGDRVKVDTRSGEYVERVR